ncbi:MAG: tRNA (N6-threonylcarbamoyladenosine(37)-N6)-methyltransferase TrmO [Candidatus Bathyarchaeota archaeon]|nr:MAG: tRNA (N6-threonylcarbamoyladenosine(37)-N6)-methyltransferase TrmO [Candidatus Bathyarchaeota archaeon]
MLKEIKLSPIGYVDTKSVGKEIRNRCNISRIVLDQGLTEGLEGIEDFSHLLVLFWMHMVPKEERRTLKTRPRGRADVPLLGMFATRTPYRPNPIGLTLVEILEVKDNIITVRGLDAVDGTPLLDIKPFDYWDTVDEVKVPDWWIRLEGKQHNI